MAGRKAKPIDLQIMQGRSNLTKAQIAARRAGEVDAPKDRIVAPSFLTPELKRAFTALAKQLQQIDLISNFDVDTLAAYVQTRAEYVSLTEKVGGLLNAAYTDIDDLNKAQNMQMRALNQLRALGSELGLSVTARAKLAIPRKEKPPENKFSRFGGAKEA